MGTTLTDVPADMPAGGTGNGAGIQPPALNIRRLKPDAPWAWLAAGASDMRQRPAISLLYGLVFSLVSFVIIYGALALTWGAAVLVLAAGFMLIGPMMAVGLYEASRRLETGQPVGLTDVLFVSTRAPVQLAFVGIILMLALLAWVRIATLLFALFFGGSGFPPLGEFIPMLLFTLPGIGLLVTGSLVGGALALLVFSISVVSVPLLLDRDVDAVTAMLASVEAVRRNPLPMLIWGWLIAFMMAIGIGTLLVGFVLAFPLVGHASWHAYRQVIEPEQ